jgi:uncharacterized protein YpmB
MKNILSVTIVVSLIVFVSLSCSYVSKFQNATSNKNAASDAAREALDLKKTGIPECDQLVESWTSAANSNSADEESWASRAGKEVLRQKIYDEISKNSNTRTPQETKDLAQNCKAMLDYFKSGNTK